ncbi:mortality factor 4-like protein 1 [Phtheirospermum japonicum]|uniref:Mortality factor 4-like protein 1 n=1 Tax=Phtheirospermum japonicum TaxID=374723 RepID=A0A830CI27_9LAMI|nr:mortality factor 4-like protein 1 [Phtheirospermum japonicum]
MVSSSREESASDGDNSSGDAPESDSKKMFSEGEKVLAYHGPRIYEAKVQRAEIRKNEWRYFVHYLGWNKNWDEWVGMDRLMKNTEENILKQQALDKKAGVDKNTKSGRSAQTKPKNSADAKVDKEEAKNVVTKGKKRKADSGIENIKVATECTMHCASGCMDNPASEKLFKIQIPPNLKKRLVDDWEQITQQNKLVKLPRSPSVDDILTKYLEIRSKKDGMMTDAVGEILNGIRCYFDKALPSILLYKKERQQYREAIQDNISPSSIYGAEHLLRLFVKLPELLAYVKIDEETTLRLQQKVLGFLKYLQNNESTLFVSSYDSPKATEKGGKGKDN